MSARPVMEVRIVFANGAQNSRFWTTDDVTIPVLEPIPPLLTDPHKSWPNPRDPIVFSALVAKGSEEDAREWLASL